MASKIEGNAPASTRVIILDENDWSIESNTVESGDYSIGDLNNNSKTVIGRATSGEVISYGNVTPINIPTIETYFDVVHNYDDGYYEPGENFHNNSNTIITDSNAERGFIRFSGLTIPPGSTIDYAYIRLVTPFNLGVSNTVVFYAEAADNATQMTTHTNRSLTSNSVTLQQGPVSGGTVINTPELKSVVQEVVDRTGWSSGNAIQFFLINTGSYTISFAAREFSGTHDPPRLYIQYTTS